MSGGFKRTDYKGRVKYVCSRCGSTDVGVDGQCYWNEEKQEFEVGGLCDEAHNVWCSNEDCPCVDGKPITVIPVQL